MWEGRFKKKNNPLMESFNRSLSFDIRLYEEDIACSTAYALALRKAGVLNVKECREIKKALSEICSDIESGSVRFFSADEDIHMAVERLLVEKVGSAGEKIHTGRSRNDQVATDMRMYVLKMTRRIFSAIDRLQTAVLEKAAVYQSAVMPAYTHLQQAQPITLGHYLLSLFFALQRDMERFAGVYETTDILPLGSGAVAGSGFKLDRNLLAKELGFSYVSENSLDAVSDRDFIIEFLSAASILMMHLSRYAEDFILWSSGAFGFLELDEAFATGSSMMPQKRNPDSLELIRGKTGRVYGDLVQLLTVMKGLPFSYAKDLQEDKESFFDASDTLLIVLPVFEGVIRSSDFSRKKMKEALDHFVLATDIADVLTRKGVPFREAHSIVGGMTRHCEKKKKSFSRLTANELKKICPLLKPVDLKKITFEKSLENRNITGGTGKKSVAAQISIARKILKERTL